MKGQSKKEDYKKENIEYLRTLSQSTRIEKLPGGVLYEIIKKGTGTISPKEWNVVTVYYKGSLISGKVFDDNTQQGYPDALRISDLIEGWQIALKQMKVGDKWKIYLPSQLGYGTRGTTGIPKNSTLIFEIELVSIA